MVAVFKPKYDMLIFWAEWLEMMRWQVNYGTSLVTGSQLPPTDMKRSHKVKLTKKDVYLSDDNLGENITEPKKKRKQKLLIASPSSESNNSSITKLNSYS